MFPNSINRRITQTQQRLQNAVGKAREHAGAKSPARAVQEDRQHLDRDRAALRQLIEFEIAQYLSKRDKDRALAQRAQAQMGLRLGHIISSSKKKLHCRNNAVHRKR